MKHQEREKRKAQVVTMWEQHYPNITVSEVSELTGLGERVIYDYLKEAGQPLPPKKYRQVDTEQVHRAHDLFAEYGNKSKVGKVMGISRQLVTYYLKKRI